MTNTIALVLGLLICSLIMGDWIIYDSQNIVFLTKKLLELIEWIAFWR